MEENWTSERVLLQRQRLAQKINLACKNLLPRADAYAKREIIFETVRKCLSERVGDTADSAFLSELVFETYKSFGFPQPTIIRFESPLKGCLAVGQINLLSEIHSLTRNVSFEVTKELLPALQAVEPNLAAWESKVCADDGWSSAVRRGSIEPFREYDLPQINHPRIENHPHQHEWKNQLLQCVEEALAKELELGFDDRSRRWSFINNDIHRLIYGQVANEVLAHIHKQIDLPITHSALCQRYASAIRQACRSAHRGALWEHLPLRQAELQIWPNSWQLSRGSEASLSYDKLSSEVGAFWIFKRVCVITSKPRAILLDSRGRLHNEQGPAIVYPDGWGVYAWHGVRVPRYVIEDPRQISVRKINSEVNAEVRRVLIERYGFPRFLQDSGAQVLDEQVDSHGHPIRLYRQEIAGDEPLVMVEVTNTTAEEVLQADGTKSLEFKRYSLRVPPDMVDARAAIAWTFDLPAKMYSPEKET